jgi:hypothetical protein
MLSIYAMVTTHKQKEKRERQKKILDRRAVLVVY